MTIVPANRLVFWTAVTLLPASALSAAIPGAPALLWLPALALLLAALADAVAALTGGAALDLEFPAEARLVKNRTDAISFAVINRRRAGGPARLGPAFPEQIQADRDRLVNLSPGESRGGFTWPCTPLERGEFRLEACRVETASILGLWSRRHQADLDTTIRVYPDLTAEKKNLAWLFCGRPAGDHALRQIGKGRDFEQLREYLPGDSFEDIHWKATARRGFPVTKTYRIERTQEVYLVIDASRLSGRPARSPRRPPDRDGQPSDRLRPAKAPTILDRFITTALMSGLAIERQGDLFGLLSFDDRIRGFVQAKNGQAHYDTCREMLYNLYSQRVSPDFREVFSFIAGTLRKRALLIFLTSLDDPVLADEFIKQVDVIAKRHVILVETIKPAGVAPVFSSAAARSPEDIYAALSGHLEWENLYQTGQRLRQKGVDLAMEEADRLSPRLTRHYLDIKRNQLL